MTAAKNAKDPAPERESAGAASFLAELRGGDAAPETPVLPGVVSRRRVNVQTLVVAAVIAASAGLLYAMRRHGMGAGMTFQTLNIEYDWERIGSVSRAHQQRVLEDLARSGEPVKPPVEHLPKNPFRLDLQTAVAVVPGQTTDPGAESARLAELNRQVREKELRSALATVHLQSTMGGRVPLARVNGKLVKVGDIVAGLFTVRAIHDRTVELEADGKVFAVIMDGPMAGEIPSGRP
jgi:hypothetical protein